MSQHISHSGLTKYLFCPYSYKIRYIDGIVMPGTIFTAFGKSIHSTCESLLLKKIDDCQKFFLDSFEKELNILTPEYKDRIFKPNNENDEGLYPILQDMMKKGGFLAKTAVNSLEKKFGKYKIIAVETEIQESILDYEKNDFDFKGIIDLIIQTEDGLYHIIDWKSCSWGWDAEKKTDKLVNYQLSYYKHFYTLINDIEPNNTQTWFCLIKRTAFTKDKKTQKEIPKEDIIEYLPITNGSRKIKNALNVLNNVVYNVDHKRFIKNKSNCKKCEWYKTKWCP